MSDYNFSDFGDDLGELIEDIEVSAQKKFLNGEVRELRKRAIKEARNIVTERTGEYIKGFKYERAKVKENRTYAKTINDADHSHLVEYGHINVDKAGNEHGFTQGKHVIANVSDEYQDEFYENAEQFIADAIQKSGLD